MKYLVSGSAGPNLEGPEDTLNVLEGVVLPTFDMLLQLEAAGTIMAGGNPLGERAFVFIVEAESNDELDRLLRNLPAWGVLEWDVVPLQSFAGRSDQERSIAADLKKVLG